MTEGMYRDSIMMLIHIYYIVLSTSPSQYADIGSACLLNY